ncbi:hypothetical protein CEXT_359371 [Caerostris extrusa]|uniref:Uncharacterized protein n=1 Tax=Caerostris extrusa TaxID=172846 RepID=A0AAV4WKN9_CAEEX|nr:hypothetical protein CEXT_359371 [Caerostris extrusa]
MESFPGAHHSAGTKQANINTPPDPLTEQTFYLRRGHHLFPSMDMACRCISIEHRVICLLPASGVWGSFFYGSGLWQSCRKGVDAFGRTNGRHFKAPPTRGASLALTWMTLSCRMDGEQSMGQSFIGWWAGRV